MPNTIDISAMDQCLLIQALEFYQAECLDAAKRHEDNGRNHVAGARREMASDCERIAAIINDCDTLTASQVQR